MLAIRTRPSSGDGNDTRGNSKQAFAQMKHIDGDSMVQFLGDGKSKPRKRLGNKKILQYWGVPKTNFDGKPPAHWGECLMNPDKVATLVPMSSPHVNWNDYFVVDKVIPLQELGRHVLTYVFYEPAVGGSAGPAIGGPEPAIGGSVHPAIDGPEPAHGGSVHPAIGHLEPAIGGSVHPATGGPEPAGGGPGPAGGGPPWAFEGEVWLAFAWVRLADELLGRSHRPPSLQWSLKKRDNGTVST